MALLFAYGINRFSHDGSVVFKRSDKIDVREYMAVFFFWLALSFATWLCF